MVESFMWYFAIPVCFRARQFLTSQFSWRRIAIEISQSCEYILDLVPQSLYTDTILLLQNVSLLELSLIFCFGLCNCCQTAV